MAKVLVNRAKMLTSTTGTGTLTLGTAIAGFQSFSDAGVQNGDVVRYVIEDGAYWELGTGTYTASGTTLTRNVVESSNSDNAINLSGDALIFVTADASDYVQIDGDVMTGDLTVTNIITSGNVDGRDVSVDGAKLDGIEANATADQTKSDIDALNINADTLDGQHGSYYTAYTDTAVGNMAATFTVFEYTATAGQTVFSGSDENGNTMAFVAINTMVTMNGIILDPSDYTVTSTTTITLDVAAVVNDVLNVIAFTSFTTADTATSAQGDTADAALPKAGGAMTGAITTNSTFDGRDVATDGTKLDGIETGATADQTASEIRALVESASDSNVFTDADHTKLNAIEASADVTDTANVVAALIAGTNITIAANGTITSTDTNTTYSIQDGELSQNNFTDADHTKLDGIETAATADQTKADIESLGIDVPATNLTGTIPAARLSTATTQAESDDSTKIATTAYVVDKITTLIGGAPSTLNDLNELAAAINDDANYNTTLTTALATKLPLAGGAITGNVTFGDNNKAIFGAGSDLQIYHDGSHSYVKDAGTGNLKIQGENVAIENTSGDLALYYVNTGVNLYHNNSAKLATTATGIDVTGNVAVSGTVDGVDIAAFKTSFDNLSTELVSDTTPQLGGALDVNGHSISFGDNEKARFGNADDLEIYHDGTNSYISDTGSGDLKITSNGNGVAINKNSSETMATFVTDGAVSLYYDNTRRFHTTSTGANVTGILALDGLHMGDGEIAKFGNSDDLQIYHDGSHSIIRDAGTGSLLIDGDEVYVRSSTGENKIIADSNGSVNLFYDNASKLSTTSSGVSVTGNLAVTGTVDGRDVATDGTKLDGIATSANNYSHPTGNGNNHIPSNGSSGQFLGYSSAGAAAWVASPSASQTVGAIGTYAFCYFDGGSTPNRDPGNTISGSSLDWASTGYLGRKTGGTQPSGTWRLMGCVGYSNNSAHTEGFLRSSLWTRIS